MRAGPPDPAQAASSKIGAEITDQLDNLVFDGFIGFIRDPWYDRLPYYCKAMLARLTLAATDLKDRLACRGDR